MTTYQQRYCGFIMSTKTCENCGREVEDFVKFCPQCGSSSFKNSNSEFTDSNPDIDSSDSINPIIAKLFYWDENGKYCFSKTKFFSILIFLDMFTGRMYYTSDIVVSLTVALIVTAISFLIGRSLHRKNDEHASGEGLVKDICNMLFYNEGHLSISKILAISLYFILIVFYCNYDGWDMFFAADLISLVFTIPAYYICKFLKLDDIIELDGKRKSNDSVEPNSSNNLHTNFKEQSNQTSKKDIPKKENIPKEKLNLIRRGSADVEVYTNVKSNTALASTALFLATGVLVGEAKEEMKWVKTRVEIKDDRIIIKKPYSYHKYKDFYKFQAFEEDDDYYIVITLKENKIILKTEEKYLGEVIVDKINGQRLSYDRVI